MIETGESVLCTVEKIEGTVVFVKVHDTEKDMDGSIVVSEIAPGRIRNLRDYVVPKKKIVCKVLRITSQNIELSLRRVSLKEKKEVIERDSQEKSSVSMLKKILGDKFESKIKEMTKEQRLSELFQEAKENPKVLEKFLEKKEIEKILEILQAQKQRKVSIKKEIHLSTINPNGIELIKEILGKIKNAEVKYISAGRYSLRIESSDPKVASLSIRAIISEIEKEAKKKGLDFSEK